MHCTYFYFRILPFLNLKSNVNSAHCISGKCMRQFHITACNLWSECSWCYTPGRHFQRKNTWGLICKCCHFLWYKCHIYLCALINSLHMKETEAFSLQSSSLFENTSFHTIRHINEVLLSAGTVNNNSYNFITEKHMLIATRLTLFHSST